MSLSLGNPVQPIIEIPPNPAAWQRCDSVLDTAARWRIYLHQLALVPLLDWFQSELDTMPQSWPETAPFDIWHVVDGLSIAFSNRKAVVILSEAMDAAVLEVPQEWVDIPEWAAHYYIAAQVEVDEQRLALWGYTTHAQLKAQAVYDPDERLYRMEDSKLIQDFAVFGAMHALETQAQGATQTVQEMQQAADHTSSAVATDELISRLAKLPEPRLEIPFGQWTQILSDRTWRRQLYQQRQGHPPVNLGRWFEQVFDQGWQALETLRPSMPAFSFRSPNVSVEANDSETPRTLPIVCSKPLSLLNAAPAQSASSSGLSPDLSGLKLVLILEGGADGRRRIQIQLHSIDAAHLPSGVVLALERVETEEALQTVQAGEQDNYIQLPSFRCPAERPFRVRIRLADSLGEQTVYEDFVS